MRGPAVLILLAFCFLRESRGVWVTDGELRFPLEAVMELKNLLEAEVMSTPDPVMCAEAPLTARPCPDPPTLGPNDVCSNPLLPREFQTVCEREGASELFNRLVDAITPLDPCEICANAACTGCLRDGDPPTTD